jgi:hypothetical protein
MRHTRFHKKKYLVLLSKLPLKYDTQTFRKRNVQMITIQLNKHKFDYVKHNILNVTEAYRFCFPIKHIFISWKINFIFLSNLPLKYDTQIFGKRNVQLISIHFNKHNFDFQRFCL